VKFVQFVAKQEGEMRKQFVRDLRPGKRVLGFFLVRHKQLEPFRDRTRGEFLTLVLADRTGEILARVWEEAPALAETFEQGQVVKVQGEVEEYLGRWQAIVEKIRPAKPDEYDLTDILPATERDVDEMLAALRVTVEEIEEPHLKALAARFLEDEEFVARFSRAPAARRIHHAYLGGLLEHTFEVVTLCKSLLEVYPQIHRDLLLTGALVHDVGKVAEFEYATDIDYSDEGRLLGHVVLSYQMVNEAIAGIPDFPADLALRLRHMILSHHGRYEWGAPRRPKTLEAVALHHVENLGAQVNRFQRILAARRESDKPWTDYDTLLGRHLYAGRNGLSIEEEGPAE
jgi:3'-5' exoribonuclease